MNPHDQATALLTANPTAWATRRAEALAVFTEWHRLAAAGTHCLLPVWLTQELPRTFPPD